LTEKAAQNSPLIDPSKVGIAAEPGSTAEATPKAAKVRGGDLAPGQYWWGTGRRKTSIARVRIRPGSGKILVNERNMDDFFTNPRDRDDVQAPLVTTDNVGRYDVFIKVEGGGMTGQAGAVLLGLSRALVIADPDSFPKLRDSGFLTRDSRMKERKKYGQKGARKRFQFSKR
jgi:small subunit ribosomal protein S9